MAAADYCTAQDIASHLQEPGLIDGGTKQTLLTSLATIASRLVDAWYGKPEGYWQADAAASIRYFDGSNGLEQWVDEMAAAPTEVAVAEDGILTTYTVWAATDYVLQPYNALAEGRPYKSLLIDRISGSKYLWYRFPKSVKITCKWGYALAAPKPIQEGTMIQAARWFKRGQQAFQDAGAVTDLMQHRYLKKLDPDVELVLSRMPGGITV